jgi:hypothetical protein
MNSASPSNRFRGQMAEPAEWTRACRRLPATELPSLRSSMASAYLSFDVDHPFPV